MTPLYATITLKKAEAVLAGRAKLSSIRLAWRYASPTRGTIEIQSTLSPPMTDQHKSLEIILDVPDDILRQHFYVPLDTPDTNYVIPRCWLDQAKCRLLSDEEIRAHCKKHLESGVILSAHTVRFYMEKAIKEGNTKHISPYYLQVIRDSPA